MSDSVDESEAMEQPASPASLKQKRLSNGDTETETKQLVHDPVQKENGMACNGGADVGSKECQENAEKEGKEGARDKDREENIKKETEKVREENDATKKKESLHVNGTGSLEKVGEEKTDTHSEEEQNNIGSEGCDKSEDTSKTNDMENQKESLESVQESDMSITEIESEKKVDGMKNVSDNESRKDPMEGKMQSNISNGHGESGNDRPGKFKRHDSDDIQIVGETKVISVSTPYSHAAPSQNVVFVPAAMSSSIGGGYPVMNQSFAATNVMQGSFSNSSPQWHSGGMGMHMGSRYNHSGISQSSKPMTMLSPTVAPPQPKSSLDQIELIRWEIHNRINTRPKYFKPNPTAELGPLAKFLFDIGSDLIKETVYHELVKIQSKKGDEGKLTGKEKDDLDKLKEIEKDLHATVGHLKVRMRKRCSSCTFHTESNNVLYLHKQFPHEEDKKLHCSHCSYFSKQPQAYKFHVEAEHNMQPRVYDRKAFYECDLCPYENNQEQKVVLHKQRCLKQFRPFFNLHPSCLSGAEINLCLENIFYKPVVPKNLKLLQQKHAQQQAALLEARRQQAQIQALAAKKNAAAAAAAAAAKKQQQLLQQQQQMRQQAALNAKMSSGIANRNMSSLAARNLLPQGKLPITPARSAVNKASRPTVANMLNSRQSSQSIPQPQAVPGGFEVCEICGGYVKDRKALRIHFFYAHRIDLPFNLFERSQAPLYCATCYVRFWTAQGLRKHIDTHKEENVAQGVVGKCISCGHHVLNLLIHMRVVHNREIQHYINALMCMFCGSHFNSRNDVERHIKLVHGNVDTVNGTLKPSSTSHPPPPSQPSKGSSRKSGGGSAVKGSVCVLCNLNFGRNVDLTRHCMRMHHTCMKCGMVVIDKASLLKHICLASPSGTRDCSMCTEKGFHPAYYVKHLRDKHLRKFAVKVARLSKSAVERWTKRPYPFQEPEAICVEISDSDEDIPLKETKKVTASPRKKLKIGPAFFMKKQRAIRDKDVVQIDDEEDSQSIPVPDSKGSQSTKESEGAKESQGKNDDVNKGEETGATSEEKCEEMGENDNAEVRSEKRKSQEEDCGSESERSHKVRKSE